MPMFSHNVYDNIRTRVIVLHEDRILLIPNMENGLLDHWKCPGGGLEPNESLSECAAREVLEETGIIVTVSGVAFLREWVVPKYAPPMEPNPDPEVKHGYTLEVFFYARPTDGSFGTPRPEWEELPVPQWVLLETVAGLPLWPKELKALTPKLCSKESEREDVKGIKAIVTSFDVPTTMAPDGLEFNPRP